MDDQNCAPIVNCLLAGSTPRVWSLLVSVFGDLVQTKDAQISGRALTAVMDAIGVKPEALRVALFRLRKDGWIESTRSGRQSYHRLTTWGRAQSVAASPRIYENNPAIRDAWVCVHDRNNAANDKESGYWVSNSIAVKSRAVRSKGVFVAKVDPNLGLPDWMSDKICPLSVVAQTRDLTRRLAACERILRKSPAMSNLQVAVLRVLVVHEWRRIILKVPELPDFTFPKGWQGTTCREHVYDLLESHPRVDLSMLEAETA